MSVIHHKETPVKLGNISIMEVTIIDDDGIVLTHRNIFVILVYILKATLHR